MNEPFLLLHEDNHVLVALKAPNVLSQADATGDADMLTLLKAYIKQKYNKPGEVYLGLLHRLDRPVGGLMVFAKTGKAAARLSEQLRLHQMGRTYLLVCEGEITEPFTLQDYLLKDEASNIVSVVPKDTQGAKLAVLHGTPRAVRNGRTLVEVALETGRSHQIRVQMKHFHHPLLGDNRYGNGQKGEQIALWGYKLAFSHPTLKEPMTFTNYPQEGAFAAFREDMNAKTLSL